MVWLSPIAPATARVSYLGKPTHWYEMHGRIVAQTGAAWYIKRLVALDARRNPLLVRMQGHVIRRTATRREADIECFVYWRRAPGQHDVCGGERRHRDQSFLVPSTIPQGRFAVRDGPMNGARRKAIVHWVARHLGH